MCFVFFLNIRTNHLLFPQPGKWQLCHHRPGGRTSTWRWWSCGPDSSRPPKALWPGLEGKACESWASWPPTERKSSKTCIHCSPSYWKVHIHTDRWVIFCCCCCFYILVPAHAFSRQMEAGSDNPGCRHTAHQSGCRLHDRLRDK